MLLVSFSTLNSYALKIIKVRDLPGRQAFLNFKGHLLSNFNFLEVAKIFRV